MKSNLLLAGSILLSLAVCSESALNLVVKILEFLGLVGLFAAKCGAGVSLCAWLTSSVVALARTAVGDSHCLAFLVLHGAVWFVKAFLFAAVFSGCGK